MTPGPGAYEPDTSVPLVTDRVIGCPFGKSKSPAHSIPVQPAMELPKEEKSAASPSKGIDFKKVTAPRLFEGMKVVDEPASAAEQKLYSSFEGGFKEGLHHKPTSSFSKMTSQKFEPPPKVTPGPGQYDVHQLDLTKTKEPRATGVPFGKLHSAEKGFRPLPFHSGETDAPPSETNPLSLKAEVDKAKAHKSSWAVSGTGDRQTAFKTGWLATKDAPIMYADPDLLKHQVQKLGTKSSNKIPFLVTSPRFDDAVIQPSRFS